MYQSHFVATTSQCEPSLKVWPGLCKYQNTYDQSEIEIAKLTKLVVYIEKYKIYCFYHFLEGDMTVVCNN